MNNIKILHYGRIDLSETRESKECGIFHYWYFVDKGFKYKSNVCNGCHKLNAKYRFDWKMWNIIKHKKWSHI